MADPRFKRGAKPSPRHKLLAVEPFKPVAVAPQPCCWQPKTQRMFGNDQEGDCVSAEEGFTKNAWQQLCDLQDQTIMDWAAKHGVANGATLTEVLDAMQSDGFVVGSQLYNDGPYKGVDYSNESVLQAAVAVGPVKIAIDANALPSGAGNNMGWVATGGSPGQFTNTDHCVAVCGFGTAQFLFRQWGVTLPAQLAPSTPGYGLYTWATCGFVDHAWIMSTCVEAWIRDPSTVGVPPLPGPTPPTPPVPPTPPTPPTPPAPVVPSWLCLLASVAVGAICPASQQTALCQLLRMGLAALCPGCCGQDKKKA